MPIPLNHFEQYIDETILKRGFSYFKKGLVRNVENTSPGEFEAVVQGTEEYDVRLTIKNEMTTEHFCSCPYADGDVCKHVAAVIFELQQDYANEIIDLYIG